MVNRALKSQSRGDISFVFPEGYVQVDVDALPFVEKHCKSSRHSVEKICEEVRFSQQMKRMASARWSNELPTRVNSVLLL